MNARKSTPDSAHPLPVLPDVLLPGLKLVFCGTAAGTVSAQRGQYYAHPQNRFWEILYEAGFTPHRLAPADYASLPAHGIGLTDVAKHSFGMDHELPRDALGRMAADALRQRIVQFAPRALAFTSLKAGRSGLGRKIGVGLQPVRFGSTQIWVLPSPSPAARKSWDAQPWHNLAHSLREIVPS